MGVLNGRRLRSFNPQPEAQACNDVDDPFADASGCGLNEEFRSLLVVKHGFGEHEQRADKKADRPEQCEQD